MSEFFDSIYNYYYKDNHLLTKAISNAGETNFMVSEIAENSAEICENNTKSSISEKGNRNIIFQKFFLNGKRKKFLEFHVEKESGIIFLLN